MSEPQQRGPWGLTDFRLSDPDGYYLRITHHPQDDYPAIDACVQDCGPQGREAGVAAAGRDQRLATGQQVGQRVAWAGSAVVAAGPEPTA
jgi:hypothetical protein